MASENDQSEGTGSTVPRSPPPGSIAIGWQARRAKPATTDRIALKTSPPSARRPGAPDYQIGSAPRSELDVRVAQMDTGVKTSTSPPETGPAFWGPLINLAPVANSDQDDRCPAFSPDYSVFYFDSERAGGGP